MNVLVVDDSPTTTAILKSALESLGHRVVDVVGNGEEALTSYLQCHPDLVTMDVVMPDMDGIEATRMIVGQDPKACILMVTTQDRMTTVSKALAAGARGYVLQPIKKDDLAKAIDMTRAHRAKIVRGTLTWVVDDTLLDPEPKKPQIAKKVELAPPPPKPTHLPRTSDTRWGRGYQGSVSFPLRTLVVEDSPVTMGVMREILRDLGHIVSGTAGTGAEALAAYRELQPDLVTMDIVMPDMDGIEATKQIIAYFPDAMIVMVTGQGWEATVVRALAAGASGYVVQPVSRSKLREVIKMIPNFRARLRNGTLTWEKRY